MTELLAPAGSLEALQAAVNAGADAVYIGGRMFGARAYAENPDESGLIDGIEYCHLRGKKLYLTVNTLFKEQELMRELIPFLVPLYEHGIDALIIQDLGVLRFLRVHFPELELHASTQMSVTTPEGAAWLKKLGVRRVVTARELSMREVRAITDAGTEVEAFIHGAMCYCYSGRCLFSSMLGGRSGNRGRCAQPCRLPYSFEENNAHCLRDGGKPSCLLSMKDMCTLDILPDLIDAGIASFKIEGRMKPPQYAAGVTSVYRKYLDLYAANGRKGYRVSEADRRILSDLFDRGGFSKGYYPGKNCHDMIARIRPAQPDVQEAQLKNERNRQFLSGNSKIKINGDLRIYPDTPVILEVWPSDQEQGGCYCIKVVSDAPQRAKTNAAVPSDVARQIKKTGNTPFEFDQLHIDLADSLFLPVRMLNELRRDALQKLEERILTLRQPHPVNRSCSVMEDKEPEAAEWKSRGCVPAKQSCRFNVLVMTNDQLDAFLSWSDMGRNPDVSEKMDTVYLDSLLLGTKKQLEENCKKLTDQMKALKARHLNCIFVCPPVLRESGREIFNHPTVMSLLEQMDGFLIQTVDELAFIRDYFTGEAFPCENEISDGQIKPDQKTQRNTPSEKILVSEDCLYCFNSEAKALLRSQGFARFTLPAELNARELSYMDLSDCEMTVYGRQPLMQSAQCLRKNVSGCDPYASGFGSLRDRKKIRFPVLSRCLFCTNTVYNSVPLNLSECRSEIDRLSPAFLRLSFTVETGAQTLQILNDFMGMSETFISEKGTRGHFKRGVE